MRLEGKSIVVTGATGIAAAAAARFVEEGASVFIISIDAAQCEALSASLDGAGWHSADLSDEGQASKAFAEARKHLGTIDGLFAAAGGSGREAGDGPVTEIPLTAWEATLSLNLTTSFLSVREAIAAMVDGGSGGSVVIVSSVLAFSPSPDLFTTHAYAAAKGAQISLTRALAARYATKRVRVNAIAPGLVRTSMSERAYNDPPTFQYAASKQPLASGFLEPDDVGLAAVFLISDESRYVTGQVLAVDAGWSVSEGRS